MDVVFAARLIQEKCEEQHRHLCMVFIDLTEAFDSVVSRVSAPAHSQGPL